AEQAQRQPAGTQAADPQAATEAPNADTESVEPTDTNGSTAAEEAIPSDAEAPRENAPATPPAAVQAPADTAATAPVKEEATPVVEPAATEEPQAEVK